jgi:hypothetical protein
MRGGVAGKGEVVIHLRCCVEEVTVDGKHFDIWDTDYYS